VTPDKEVRKQLLYQLDGGNAHAPFPEIIEGYPIEIVNQAPPGAPFNAWGVLEHMRIAQWDILEFIRNPKHVSPQWPEDTWPPPGQQADAAMWQGSVDTVLAEWKALRDIVDDPNTDLYSDIPHAPGYTILREILVVSDHNAYHMAELAMLRTMLTGKPL
jgi:hypothetical protein